MKVLGSLLGTLIACVLLVSPTFAKTPKPPSLKEIIASPQHLKESLGKKTLIQSGPKRGQPSSELAKVIQNASLSEVTEFFVLPDEGTEPDPIRRKAPEFPSRQRRPGAMGSVKFLLFIGADGTVKSLYCYESTHPDFALAAAEALVAWKFNPATIAGTPVPMLVRQSMEFSTE